uniref:Uncharacterized protein n=1 Tax=Triticum urartu TaxID=4572 RepID=A0A8R7QBR0_TRIUA
MDKSMLGDLDNLPDEDKMRMSAMIEQLQMRDRRFSWRRNKLSKMCICGTWAMISFRYNL